MSVKKGLWDQINFCKHDAMQMLICLLLQLHKITFILVMQDMQKNKLKIEQLNCNGFMALNIIWFKASKNTFVMHIFAEVTLDNKSINPKSNDMDSQGSDDSNSSSSTSSESRRRRRCTIL